MANDVNKIEPQDQTLHADRTNNNNTKDQATLPKQTPQVTKDQQENERITGDIFYPISLEHPTPQSL